MPLRALLRLLVNNEKLIEKLSESYPLRRAAQLTTYLIHRGKEFGDESLDKLKNSDTANRFQQEVDHKQKQAKSSYERSNSFLVRFFNNLEEEWKKAEKNLENERTKKIGQKKADDP